MMINHEHTLFQDRNVCLQDALDKWIFNYLFIWLLAAKTKFCLYILFNTNLEVYMIIEVLQFLFSYF